MANIMYCFRCKKQYIAEESKDHENCIFGVKEIPIYYSFTTEDNGKKIIIARGVDGLLYRLVKC
jgi:hypothetical protein